jgi:hypothetical protein
VPAAQAIAATAPAKDGGVLGLFQQDSGRAEPAEATRAIMAVVATVAALVVGSIPTIVFWFVVRDASGAYRAGSETLVVIATPFVAGFMFALVTPRPILRWSATFAAVLAVPLALLTILVIYKGDLDGLGSAPLATVAAWVLCWVVGFVGAAMASRARAWAADFRATSLRHWLQGWWTRRTCSHDWELQATEKLLGGRHGGTPRVEYHYIYVYRCRICGAVKERSDRWGPA